MVFWLTYNLFWSLDSSVSPRCPAPGVLGTDQASGCTRSPTGTPLPVLTAEIPGPEGLVFSASDFRPPLPRDSRTSGDSSGDWIRSRESGFGVDLFLTAETPFWNLCLRFLHSLVFSLSFGENVRFRM